MAACRSPSTLPLPALHSPPCLPAGYPKRQDTWSRVCGYVEQQVRAGFRTCVCVCVYTCVHKCLCAPVWWCGGGACQSSAPPGLCSLPLFNWPLLSPSPRPLQDLHSGRSTVAESLMFSARLRLPGEIPLDKVCGMAGGSHLLGCGSGSGPSPTCCRRSGLPCCLPSSWWGALHCCLRVCALCVCYRKHCLPACPTVAPCLNCPQVSQLVEETLEMTELTRLRHSIVGEGDGGQGLSMEQRKRLSIAVELVAAPAVMFLE